MSPFQATAESMSGRVWLPAPSGIFGLTLFLILILTQGAKLLVDGDTYTHIRIGEWMLDNGRLFEADIYSHTANGTAWIAHEWGAEIIMARLHDYGGLAAVGIFYALLAALSFTILYKLLEDLGTPPFPALALLTATFLVAYPHLYARPHMFTWLFLSLTLLIYHHKGRWLLALPFITLLWVNLHGGFIVGLLFQTVFLLGELLDHRSAGWLNALRQQRKELVILLASSAITGLNPYGYSIFTIFASAGSIEITGYNPEWWSADFQTFWPFRFYLIVLLLGLLFNKKKLPWRHWLLIGVFMEAALTHRRHISLAVICLLPVMQDLLLPSTPERKTRNKAFLANLSGWTGPLATTLCGLILLATSSTSLPQFAKRFPLSERCPQQAFTFMAEHQIAGPVYNEYSWGSCLIYAFDRQVPVFIDGFAEKYQDGVLDDYYKIAHVEPQAEELLEEYSVAWILFPTEAPLTRYLLKTGRWSETYRDAQASILERAPVFKE